MISQRRQQKEAAVDLSTPIEVSAVEAVNQGSIFKPGSPICRILGEFFT
jgi:hypothetical protein